MSDEAVPTSEETTETPAPVRGKGVFSLIKAVGFVSVIVIVEVVAAAMLAPSAQETEKLAQQYVAAREGHATTDSHDEEHGESGGSGHDVSEVELGTYNITRFNPTTNSTLAIDFELYAVVLASDAPELQHLFEKSQARVREQVTMSLHAATSADLTEAGLGLIKRRILEKTNHALGHPLVKEVVFSKFNYVER